MVLCDSIYVELGSPCAQSDLPFIKEDLRQSREVPIATTLLERRLSSGSTASTSLTSNVASQSSQSSTGSHGEHDHAHDALFFLFNALISGTVLLHISTHPKLHSLQQTVCLFVLGVIYSLVQEGLNFKDKAGVFGKSYDMWMDIDPHLLLFTMLPALLAGDAMTIDTFVARNVAQQCIFLAGPGVLFGSFATAGFLKLYLGWDFLLCLVTGSILAATDPVAVVGLLKDLGASPTLTVQIQGESLLNDGTAIVLYTIAYRMLEGEEYDASDVVIFLVLVAFCAVGLGVIIGWLFLQWIKLASNRFDHNAGLIQTALTLICAYWSFCIAEGWMKISGVLCTVSASLVLADKMWPAIVDKSSMLHIWHMFEYLGNTIIFFLAGALTGDVMVEIDGADILHLIVIYLVCLCIRGVLIFGSRPILSYLGAEAQEVSLADCAVMTWGGLRGAVGLALAIQVYKDRADNHVAIEEGRRVLFFVGGIAMMTLCVNATTCPALVRRLGITRTPEAKQRMLMQIFKQLGTCVKEGKPSKRVGNSVQKVLKELDQYLQQTLATRNAETESRTLAVVRPAAEITEHLEESRAKFHEQVTSNHTDLLDISLSPLVEKEEELASFIREHAISASEMKSVHEVFLSLLRNQYWHQIADGEFFGNNGEAEMLLTSVSFAFKYSGDHLSDLGHLLRQLGATHVETGTEDSKVRELIQAEEEACESPREHRISQLSAFMEGPHCNRRKRALQKLKSMIHRDKRQTKTRIVAFVDAVHFNVCISAVLILNAIFIVIEQTMRKDDNYHSSIWIVLEIIFFLIFLSEFMLKLIGLKCRYFFDSWNVFDFVLLLLSLFGIIMEFVASGVDDGNNVSKEARLFRLNRMFRILRVLRLFRLFKIFVLFRARLRHEDISFQLAEHLKTISICRAFAKAHIKSQSQLLSYLGKNGSVANAEQARCILESQIEVYKALAMAAVEADGVDVSVHFFMKLLRQSIQSVGKLSKFVDDAHSRGVISGREAETIMHSFDDHVRTFYRHMQKTVSGRRPSTTSLDSLTGSDVPHEPVPVMMVSDDSYPSEGMLAAVNS